MTELTKQITESLASSIELHKASLRTILRLQDDLRAQREAVDRALACVNVWRKKALALENQKTLCQLDY